MPEIEEILHRWKDTLCGNVSVGGVLARNPVAHKWKATHRSLVLRESVSWRTHDLLTQAQLLYEAGHILGSRILIRSALESVATLIYLNQLTSQVLTGALDFKTFEQKTSTLLLGSRDSSTKHTSMSIVSVLEKCEKKYNGITGIYATLSECAHPNFEGICFGYSDVDFECKETNFSNKWASMWADTHESLVKLVCTAFETEYNHVWKLQMEGLEAWLTTHDAEL
mgnify:CR=1 FL=1